MGRHKQENQGDTYRGKREIVKQLKLLRLAYKEQKKAEKTELTKKGLCKGPDGNVYTNSQVGRKL